MHEYRLSDGTRVPSVTTITGRFKDSGGLVYWAWDLGRQGLDYRDEKSKAADVGTVAHGIIERVNTGREDHEIDAYVVAALPDPVLRAKAYQAAESYLAWARQMSITPWKQEIEIISEVHRFGGRIDTVAHEGLGKAKRLVLCDWKTSNSAYPEYLVQLAAYMFGWNEVFPRMPVTGAHLLRFSKDTAEFHHHYYEDLTEPWEQFLRFRACYETDKRLKKRL